MTWAATAPSGYGGRGTPRLPDRTSGSAKGLSDLDTRTLVLLRHAHAGHPGGVRDHDRPLTEAGRADAAVAGEWLRAHLEPVQEILCSTATRTRQTALATGLDAPARLDVGLYDASPEDVLSRVRATDAAVHTLLVVGHAPGVPSLAAQLIDSGTADGRRAADELLGHFPTAALAVLRFDGPWAELADGRAQLALFHLARA